MTTCNSCGKKDTATEDWWPEQYGSRRYVQLPPGWLYGKYYGADGWMDAQPVCSLDCAKALEAKRVWRLEDAGDVSGDDSLRGSQVAVLRDGGGLVVMVAPPDRLRGPVSKPQA